jgi:hypothetical protein
MKTILLKKQIILFVFMLFSTNLFAQIPADPGDDPFNTSEAGKQSQSITPPDKDEDDVNSSEENKPTIAVLPVAEVAINRKDSKKNTASKTNEKKNSAAQQPSSKKKK